MAHTKSGGSTKLGRDSKAKRLGVKLFASQAVLPGMVIVRQRGTRYLAGEGVRRGADDTLYALKPGRVFFVQKKKKRFDGSSRLATFVEVR